MQKSGSVGRRIVLTGAASATCVSLSGCLSELRAAVTHSAPETVDVTIKTLPGDEDPTAVQIGRRLRSNLETSGMDATIELKTEAELLRDFLFDFDFDIIVTRHPGHGDPDSLRPYLHSIYTEEPGWQNPFGLSSEAIDQLLDEQVGRVESRWETVAELQHELTSRMPFSTVAAPQRLTAVRSGFDEEWGGRNPDSIPSYLAPGDPSDPIEECRIGVFQNHATINQNVLAIEYRTNDQLIDLLYDPLVRSIGDEYVPWLAESWTLDDEGDNTTLTVTLRDDVHWHDGTPVDADDVAFTYRFLADTALGEAEITVPAPRFRRQSSLVESIDVPERVQIRLDLVDCNPQVCLDTLTVPILPAHRWRERIETIQEFLTEAVLDDIEDPIGSGPFQFVESTPDESLVLERNVDHFLLDGRPIPDVLEPYRPGIERLDVTVPPNALTAVELLDNDDLDLIGSRIDPEAATEAENRSNVAVHAHETPSYYFIGYNVRRHPFGDHQFRRAVARLIDREHIAETVFQNTAAPIDSPLHSSPFLAAEYRWRGESSAGPFPGSNGELDPDQARDVFREVGYRYGDDGRLVTQQ